MDLSEIRKHIKTIQEVEQNQPLLSYTWVPEKFPGDPKSIHQAEFFEDCSYFKLVSENLDILGSLVSSLTSESERNFFWSEIEINFREGSSQIGGRSRVSKYCPLFFEVMLRYGDQRRAVNMLVNSFYPNYDYYAVLGQIAEDLKFNHDIFSNETLDELENFWARILARKEIKEIYTKEDSFDSRSQKAAMVRYFNEITTKINYVRRLRLKKFLFEHQNPEINSDRNKVISFISSLQLDEKLIQVLGEIDEKFQFGATGFEFKDCMGHLRSFIEGLHEQVASSIASEEGEQYPEREGERRTYLRQKGLISPSEERFFSELYTFISDVGVHPLMSERELVRISKNVVIEYALLLLERLNEFKPGQTPHSGSQATF